MVVTKFAHLALFARRNSPPPVALETLRLNTLWLLYGMTVTASSTSQILFSAVSALFLFLGKHLAEGTWQR